MKNFNLFIVISCLLIISCDSNPEDSKGSLNNNKIMKVLFEKDLPTQIELYNLLSKEEKFRIWDSKISELLNDPKLDNNQLNLLIELRSKLNSNIFDINPINNEREIFKNIYTNNFLERALKFFPKEYIKVNFFQISQSVLFRDLGIEDPFDPEAKPDCTCNKGSAFSCNWNIDECRSSNKCKTTSGACGFLGLFSCNGRCFFP